MLFVMFAQLFNTPFTPWTIVLEWEPTVRASKFNQTEPSTSAPVEEVDLGWVTTNRRAPQPQSKSKSRAEEPSAIQSDEDKDEDDDVDEMGEIEVDVKRAEQKRVEKDLRREANVSQSASCS
jgi:hypothetical protein